MAAVVTIFPDTVSTCEIAQGGFHRLSDSKSVRSLQQVYNVVRNGIVDAGASSSTYVHSLQSCWNRVHDHGEGGYLPLELYSIVDAVVLYKVSEYLPILSWHLFPDDAVRRLIAEVAVDQHEKFSHRFEQAGSLSVQLSLLRFYPALVSFVRKVDDAGALCGQP